MALAGFIQSIEDQDEPPIFCDRGLLHDTLGRRMLCRCHRMPKQCRAPCRWASKKLLAVSPENSRSPDPQP